MLFADTVGDLGFAHELGNYGEYSGAPNTAETYAYAKTVLECATSNPDGRGRALLVGGGIANFTGMTCRGRGGCRRAWVWTRACMYACADHKDAYRTPQCVRVRVLREDIVALCLLSSVGVVEGRGGGRVEASSNHVRQYCAEVCHNKP